LRPDPGLDQAVLALEEAVAADTASGAALRRVLGEGGDLDRGAAGARERARARPATVPTPSGAAAPCPVPGWAASGPTAPNQMTLAPPSSLMPAMPPAGSPCGRTEPAGKGSSCASL